MPTLPTKPKIFPYLTVIEDRNPVQKMHATLGHAKNAFSFEEWYGGRYGQMYEYKDGDWVLLYDIPKPEIVEEIPRTRSDGSVYYIAKRYADTRPRKQAKPKCSESFSSSTSLRQPSGHSFQFSIPFTNPMPTSPAPHM
jgi:hypothetical protein